MLDGRLADLGDPARGEALDRCAGLIEMKGVVDAHLANDVTALAGGLDEILALQTQERVSHRCAADGELVRQLVHYQALPRRYLTGQQCFAEPDRKSTRLNSSHANIS